MDPDRPGGELMTLTARLQEALTLEPKFQPQLELPHASNEPEEITAGIRDGSAHVLRCLKVWYDLPSDVLFVAINLMDRFLTKMMSKCMIRIWMSELKAATCWRKRFDQSEDAYIARSRVINRAHASEIRLGQAKLARVAEKVISYLGGFRDCSQARPKHMACISVAAFQLAARQVAAALRPDETVEIPDPRDLAAISQCKCTLGDLARMEGIISLKLGAEPNTLPVTSLTFVRLLNSIFAAAAKEAGVADAYAQAMSRRPVWVQLEIIACDVTCANYRPVEIALVLICATLHLSTIEFPEISRLVGLALELRRMCKITDESFCLCHEAVVRILGRYNAHTQMPYRQRLVWRLSPRTMRLLRPTDKLVSTLPTIDEHGQLQLPLRTRFGSVSSEESWESGEEWPPSGMESVAEEDEVPPSTFHCDLA